ncbi:MAG TPA: PEP/pyruvate-binding domain-containing protein, partial [Myxococcales bacterium]|nr:PEP/pyruvate-binding domain-containing protein [Myxococcales bacterium]
MIDGAVCSFRDLPGTAAEAMAGRKGATLAGLMRAGYPVPDGFVVLPAAFEEDALSAAARPRVLAALAALRGGDAGMAFAVRSSATDEDSAGSSFAGAFDTVLDVKGDEEVLSAIERVRSSRHSARAESYAEARHAGTSREMAVVVQRLVRAEVSGVLFTADPVSG